jgi:hypothetical protein
MISPGRLWWLLRRDLRRGWSASRHHYKTLPRIREWQRPFWSEQRQAIPVHVLTGKNDWELAAWMLASWFHFSERAWPVVIHDDGTLTAEAADTFKKLFGDPEIIARAKADAEMEKVLKPFPFLYEYRELHPMALKILDARHFNKGERMLVFDSDLLFFDYPREIMDWVEKGSHECFFNEDVAEASLVSVEEAKAELEVTLWERVNAGLALIYTPAIDFEFCDRVLAETGILRGNIWRVEQTLYALCASRKNEGGLLSKRYEVSLGKHSAPDVVARHYVGAVRDRFYGEGLARLAGVLLPK